MGLRRCWPVLAALVLAFAAQALAAGPHGARLAAPRRIVALAPSVTEIVFALDGGGLLVGASEHSDHPPAARELPRVGSYDRPDLERIVALDPDLCLGVEDGTPPALAARLAGLGIPTELLATSTLEELFAATLRIGGLIGREDQARALVDAMAAHIERIRARVAVSRARPRVLFQVSGPRIMVAGQGSLLGRLIELAGGENAAPHGALYPQLSAEEFLRAAPDIVVAFHMLGNGAGMSGWPHDPLIPAVRGDRLYSVDPDLFGRPGPRVADALERLARIVHPECFGPEDGGDSGGALRAKDRP